MLPYIIAILAFLVFYRNIQIIWIKKRNRVYSHPMPKARPFFYKKSKKVGILMIHGFTGTTWDYRGLGKYLSEKNITCLGMRVAGHGTTPEHLATTTDVDWKKSVDDAYEEISAYCKKVFIVGLSFGGNLAIVSSKKVKPEGIILLGTPIRFKRERLLKMIYYILEYIKLFQKKRYHRTLDEKTEKERVTYDRIPINVIKYVAKTMKESKKALPNIKCPSLIMQSTTDHSLDERSVDYIYKKIGSKKKKVVWVENAYHVFIVGKNKEKSFKEIYNFIKENS